MGKLTPTPYAAGIGGKECRGARPNALFREALSCLSGKGRCLRHGSARAAGNLRLLVYGTYPFEEPSVRAAEAVRRRQPRLLP